MGPNPKRHHFLPEFYLNGFSRDGYVWLYDRERSQFRRQSVHDTAVIRYYYAFENEKGERDFSVESFLSGVEGKAKSIIVQLQARGAIKPHERLDLAHFIALLMVRTPKFHSEVNEMADAAGKHLMKHMISTVEDAGKLVHQYGNKAGQVEITAESMFKFIHNEEFSVEMTRDFVIGRMLDLAQRVCIEVAMMDWIVVHCEEPSAFITTDEPIGFVVPDKYRQTGEPVLGLASQKITKFVPLSQSVALILGQYGGGFGHRGIHREEMSKLNILVARECQAYVIGRDEALVRSVVKRSKVDNSNPGTRMKVDHVPHPTDPDKTYLVARRVLADAPDTPLKIIMKKQQ